MANLKEKLELLEFGTCKLVSAPTPSDCGLALLHSCKCAPARFVRATKAADHNQIYYYSFARGVATVDSDGAKIYFFECCVRIAMALVLKVLRIHCFNCEIIYF